MNWIFAIISGSIGLIFLCSKKYYRDGLLISMVPVHRFIVITLTIYIILILIYYRN